MGAIVEFEDGTHSFIATGITTTKSSAGDVVANQWYDSLAKYGNENLSKIRGILSDRAKSQARANLILAERLENEFPSSQAKLKNPILPNPLDFQIFNLQKALEIISCELHMLSNIGWF